MTKRKKKNSEEKKEELESRGGSSRRKRNVQVNLKNSDNPASETLESYFLKLHLFGEKNNLSEFKYTDHYKLHLLDNNKSIDIPKTFNINYTYMEVREILSKFKSLLIMDSELPYEKQINGKFLKVKRDDGVVEFRSKWIYTFNVPKDNYEITIGIHQASKNFGGSNSYIYAGFVILKANGRKILNLVDFLPMKDNRQGFLKVKLNKGVYIVVPM